ncbi:hypothetical protein HUU62_21390 [Rhodoferax sp. 4810]|nr:hypothetical protein [Rhodoferax jenense]
MMKLLDTDGAWIAIGISVFFIVVGVVMKRVFVNILKKSAQESEAPSATSETQKHD